MRKRRQRTNSPNPPQKQGPPADTRVDATLRKMKNHPMLAGAIVLGLVLSAIATTTDSATKLVTFIKVLRSASQPKYVELIKNVAPYVIDASLERVRFSGAVVLTPVGLFSDPGKLADGNPTGYTYLLCRFTNKSATPVTVGAVVDETGSWYTLDNPRFGYEPTLVTLAQFQRWFRGRPIARNELLQKVPDGLMEAATLPAGATKYGYVNGLGRPWPKELTISLIDVTDTETGSMSLRIQVNRQKDEHPQGVVPASQETAR